MNIKLMLKLTGKTLLVLDALLLIPLLVSLWYGESVRPFLFTILPLTVFGGGLTLIPAKSRGFSHDGFFAVGFIWPLYGICGAFPFLFSGYFSSFIDCLFESISGFTTTSATVLMQIEHLPRGILFWRSMTNFLGGMGVLVLTVALLPKLGIRPTQVMWAESPGPIKSKLVPKSSDSSKILYAIYLALTALMILALLMSGMPLFDSVTNAFATAGTGGLSIRNFSIGSYVNPAAEVIITVFMLLFSINFSAYFFLLCGKWKQVARSDELRFFCGAALISTVLITLNIRPIYASIGEALRHAAFQSASFLSSTGFFTVNFDVWPEFSRNLLLLLMMSGACAGSTGGGLKVSRVLLLLKSLSREIRQIIHPRSISVVKLDGLAVEEKTLHTVHSYFATYMVLIFAAALIVSLDNHSFGTTLSSVLACINNIGPGLELVGPLGSYSIFSPLSKVVLSLCMILGRLEIFPVLILFSRAAWRRT